MRIAICSSHDTFVVISRKLRHVADCRFVADTTSLLSTLETGAFAAVIISACASGDADVLHIMKRQRADLSVIGWIPESLTGDSFVLSNMSVSKLVFENDPGAVQRIADEAVSTTIVRAMGLAMLPLLETGNIGAAVAAGTMLLDARNMRSLSELAARQQISRRTLYNRIRALDLPFPEPMLVWCRLLAISAMIRDGGTSINFAARAMGYSSPVAVRNAAKRYLGWPLSNATQLAATSIVVNAYTNFLNTGGTLRRAGNPMPIMIEAVLGHFNPAWVHPPTTPPPPPG